MVPESSIFTDLVDEEYDTSATEDTSEDDANVLPEPILLLFSPNQLIIVLINAMIKDR